MDGVLGVSYIRLKKQFLIGKLTEMLIFVVVDISTLPISILVSHPVPLPLPLGLELHGPKRQPRPSTQRPVQKGRSSGQAGLHSLPAIHGKSKSTPIIMVLSVELTIS